jgi:hypothetical protein
VPPSLTAPLAADVGEVGQVLLNRWSLQLVPKVRSIRQTMRRPCCTLLLHPCILIEASMLARKPIARGPRVPRLADPHRLPQGWREQVRSGRQAVARGEQ